MFTKTFWNTFDAYQAGYRIIVNKGGARSGKTFSELQLIDMILQKKQKKIVTTVSHSHPHLLGGAIRDYDTILTERGVSPDSIRIKNPYIYTYPNSSIHEFISFDRPGKSLGPARDILFINEGNKITFDICHQLMQRTRETIFIDYNPASRFWIDDQGIINRPDCIVLTSTFLDNYQNLTAGQIDDFKEAKRKMQEEKDKGVYGYWSNWWAVYGKGELGQVEGAIYTNWVIGPFDDSLQVIYGLDFGSRDPDAFIQVAIDRKNEIIYAKELIYRSGNSTNQLAELIKLKYIDNSLIVADSAGKRTIDDLKGYKFNIKPVNKGAGSVIEGIKLIQNYKIIVSPDSYNLINELNGYVWLERNGEIPLDSNNHLLDALRYAVTTAIKPFSVRPKNRAL